MAGKYCDNWLKDEQRFFDDQAESYLETHSNVLNWQLPTEKYLLKYLSLKKQTIIVDIGCGPATTIKEKLLPKVCTEDFFYYGIDISYRQLLNAQKNIPFGFFIQCDAQKLPFLSSSVDYVFSFGTLHHIPNAEAAFKNALHILSPGGYLLLQEPNENSRFEYSKAASPHEHGINFSLIKEIVEQGEYEVLSDVNHNSLYRHFLFTLLGKIGLGYLIRWCFFMQFEVIIEEFLCKTLGKYLSLFKGMVNYMTIKKKESSCNQHRNQRMPLCCLECSGVLVKSNNAFICGRCEKLYPFKNDILIMI